MRADDSNWKHGFNSGCMATARLFLGLSNIVGPRVWEDDFSEDSEGEPLEPHVESVKSQRNEELDQFPNLDT